MFPHAVCTFRFDKRNKYYMSNNLNEMSSNILANKSTLFEILATLEYNSERAVPMEELLKKFLNNPRTLDISKEARVIATNLDGIIRKGIDTTNNEENLISQLFSLQPILNNYIPDQFVPEYLELKYGPFAKEFEIRYRIPFDSLLIFSTNLKLRLLEKRMHFGHKDEVYQFSTKKEYMDLGFVKIPPNDYVKRLTKVLTFGLDEFYKFNSEILSIEGTDFVINLLSNSVYDKPNITDLNFFHKPLLRINPNEVTVLTPNYLIKNLPVVYERLLRNVPAFFDRKGKAFEYLSQETLKMLHFKSLSFNRRYMDFEVDAIMELEKSNWIIEIKSHPPSEKALTGNRIAIERDLEKTIRHAILQSKRCLRNLNSQPLAYFGSNGKRNGIIIIIDGLYPQLNPSTAVRFFKETVPVYVINWIDLRTICDQPDISLFEDFLLWRTMEPMPVFCFQETDYWSFYADRYRKSKEVRDAFNRMQKTNQKLIYISPRFNDRRYLQNFVKGKNGRDSNAKY